MIRFNKNGQENIMAEKVFYNSDFHIHSENSCDMASLKMQDMADQTKAAGVDICGVSDHLHTPVNLTDIHNSYKAFKKIKREGFHFGIELSVISKWELDRILRNDYDRNAPPVYGFRTGGPENGPLELGMDAETIAAFNIEYAIGGVHWPMYAARELDTLIKDYHRQLMFLAQDERIDIIAHPWWWMISAESPEPMWTADFTSVPKAMHEEFAAAVKESGKCVEINLDAMLFNPWYSNEFKKQYLKYLRMIFEKGIPMTIGSDCHKNHYPDTQAAVAEALGSAGFKYGDFSMPKFRK
jgi:histidinol phosphatase-like PHP family hydrolase